jgi:hypothetical protein
VYYSNRAGAYLNKGDPKLALDDANMCIQCDNKFIKGYTRKAVAYE